MTPGPGRQKCTPYCRPGPGGMPLVLPLSEELGSAFDTLRRPIADFFIADHSASREALGQEQARYSVAAEPAKMKQGAWRRAGPSQSSAFLLLRVAHQQAVLIEFDIPAFPMLRRLISSVFGDGIRNSTSDLPALTLAFLPTTTALKAGKELNCIWFSATDSEDSATLRCAVFALPNV